MAALDDVDGINLQVAQVRHRCRGGLRAGAEGFGAVQALGMQPDSAALDGGELEVLILQSRTQMTKKMTLPQLPLSTGSIFRYWIAETQPILDESQVLYFC
jgi:hypothetical protein